MSAIGDRLAVLGIQLPVRASCVDLGDVEGRDFATIDVNGERDDGDVVRIATLMAEAINIVCAGPARPPLIDLRTAPSAMEQRFAGRGPR